VIYVAESETAAQAAGRQFAISAARSGGRDRQLRSQLGQSRSPLARYEVWLLELVHREPDLKLDEIQGRRLNEHQRKAGIGRRDKIY
jgi:hypothetical protein